MKDIVAHNRHSELALRDSDGVAHIVVALERDLLSDELHRVRIAGGAANTFVQMDYGQLYFAAFSPLDHESVEDRFESDPIHSDIEIGMFVAWAMNMGTVAFSIRLPIDCAEVSDIRELATSNR